MINPFTIRARNLCNKCFKIKDRAGHLCKKCFLETTLKNRLSRTIEIKKLKLEFEKELPQMFEKAKKELNEKKW